MLAVVLVELVELVVLDVLAVLDDVDVVLTVLVVLAVDDVVEAVELVEVVVCTAGVALLNTMSVTSNGVLSPAGNRNSNLYIPSDRPAQRGVMTVPDV